MEYWALREIKNKIERIESVLFKKKDLSSLCGLAQIREEGEPIEVREYSSNIERINENIDFLKRHIDISFKRLYRFVYLILASCFCATIIFQLFL